MTTHFACTQCGRCCHDLRLTLSVDEAIVWAGKGHAVQLLTEALPWPGHSDAHDHGAMHDRERSFPAWSGDVPLRIAAVLVAYHEGACPHLLPDMRCGNYADRPRICRIYPLEARPFTRLQPDRKRCPPEAWTADRPLLMQGEAIADELDASIVAEHRRMARSDVPTVMRACAILGVATAAFANEGMVVHPPDRATLVAALQSAKTTEPAGREPTQWTIVTNRRSTHTLLGEAGCRTSMTRQGPGYLGSFPDEA